MADKPQTCPKCGTPVPPNGVVCAVCDCILDLSFLEIPEERPPDDDDMLFDEEKTGSEHIALGAEQLPAPPDDETPTIGESQAPGFASSDYLEARAALARALADQSRDNEHDDADALADGAIRTVGDAVDDVVDSEDVRSLDDVNADHSLPPMPAGVPRTHAEDVVPALQDDDPRTVVGGSVPADLADFADDDTGLIAHTHADGEAVATAGGMTIGDPPLVDDDVGDGSPLVNLGDDDDGRGAYGGEAIILGNVAAASDFESMLSDATSSVPIVRLDDDPESGQPRASTAFDASGGIARIFEPATVYVAGNIAKMVEPDAVLALREGANLAVLQLSPFEQHVLSFIDGERPVARIRKKAGLAAADLKIAIGMLADRSLIVVKGHIKPDVRSMLDVGDLDESADIDLPPPVMDLPLDAMSPLPLPHPRQDAKAAHGDDEGDDTAATARPASRPASRPPAAAPGPGAAPFDDDESVFSGSTPLRPSMATKPAAASVSRSPGNAAGATHDARMNLGNASPGALPRTATPVSATPVSAPVSATPASAPVPKSVQAAARQPVEPGARQKALQVLELGMTDLRAGKRARALTYVKMAAELDPTNEKAQSLLKDWGKADKLAKSEAEDQLLVADAQRCEDQGQYDRAVELYRKALTLKPNEPELHNRIGILYALRLQDFSSATNSLMKACELAPDNLAYRSNLGKIFKFAEGAKLTQLHRGTDSDALREAANAARKPQGLLDKLRKK